MKLSIPILLAFMGLLSCTDAYSQAAAVVIDSAKAVDVATLDPALPSQPLDKWLRSAIPTLDTVKWDVSSCCNCDRRDNRICVRFLFATKEGVAGAGIVNLGSRGHMLQSPPRIESLEVQPELHPSTKLSNLPRAVTEHIAVISVAKHIDVRALDSSMPSQTLEIWLHTVGLTDLKWAVSDCDVKPDQSENRPRPLCVKFAFDRGRASGFGLVKIGTIQQGISGSPELKYVVISRGTGAQMQFETASKLSQVPHILARGR